MAEKPLDGLDTPRLNKRRIPTMGMSNETFGRISEAFARFMGTPRFLVGMTIFCFVWLAWNTWMPESAQFDPRALNYTLLTLILSLQASYAAPLILLAENRSADRDRVEFENDRMRAERNLADTEFLTREVASLRIAMRDMATRDFIRSELRNLLEEMEAQRTAEEPGAGEDDRHPAEADRTAEANHTNGTQRTGGAHRSGGAQRTGGTHRSAAEHRACTQDEGLPWNRHNRDREDS